MQWFQNNIPTNGMLTSCSGAMCPGSGSDPERKFDNGFHYYYILIPTCCHATEVVIVSKTYH